MSFKVIETGTIRKVKVKVMWIYSRETSKALRHGSHSFTCKLHHACLYLVSVHQMALPLTCDSVRLIRKLGVRFSIRLPWQLWLYLASFPRYRDIGQKSRFFHIVLHSTPSLGGGPRRTISLPFGMEKREWYGYPKVKKA